MKVSCLYIKHFYSSTVYMYKRIVTMYMYMYMYTYRIFFHLYTCDLQLQSGIGRLCQGITVHLVSIYTVHEHYVHSTLEY